MKEDSLLPENALYQTPLSALVPLALAGAINRKGMVREHNVVILCDDIHEFVRYNPQVNEQFLRDLAQALDKQTTLTFIGSSRLDWDAKTILGDERVLPLGWD